MERIEVIGKIDTMMPIAAITEKFSKREIIVSFADSKGYQQFVKVSFYNSSIELLDAYKVGDDVSITCNLAGRKLVGKTNGDLMVYNTLEATTIKAGPVTQAPRLAQRDDVIILAPGEPDIELPF